MIKVKQVQAIEWYPSISVININIKWADLKEDCKVNRKVNESIVQMETTYYEQSNILLTPISILCFQFVVLALCVAAAAAGGYGGGQSHQHVQQ